ncbi:hypothetical protein L1887_08149 [Cichorium endivia]|nr:hypothetical protein L1887_08149 [Cichorium endivia]
MWQPGVQSAPIDEQSTSRQQQEIRISIPSYQSRPCPDLINEVLLRKNEGGMLHTGTEAKRKLGRKENKGKGKCLGTKEENGGMVVVGGAVAYMEEPTGET